MLEFIISYLICKVVVLQLVFQIFFRQNGVKSSIKPQQITFVVPGVGDFDRADIQDFIKKAQDNLVCSFTNLTIIFPFH